MSELTSSTVTSRRRPAGVGDAERDVAGAAGDVEMAKGAMPRRVQLGDEHVLPDPVQTRRHQVVHQVVAVGDLVEDVVDQTLLLVEPDVAVAKVSFLSVNGHWPLQTARS